MFAGVRGAYSRFFMADGFFMAAGLAFFLEVALPRDPRFLRFAPETNPSADASVGLVQKPHRSEKAP